MLEQLVYVSRAAFTTRADSGGVEPEVGRILMTSQRNNPQRGLVGALYFGNGCFFQCLEGDSDALDELQGRLKADPRHEDMRVLRRGPIAERSFARWSMKYVPVADEVQRTLRKHGHKRFDPYRFDEAAVDAFVGLLQKRPDTAPDARDSAPPGRAGATGGSARAEPLAWCALATAALSLVLSVLALLPG